MLLEKLEGIENRYRELTQLLAQAEVIANRENFTKLNKEHAELAPIVFAFEEYKKVCKELEDSKALLDETKEDELKELALLDIENLKEREDKLKSELLYLIAPKDPNDDKNIILEIRAGTGGDESSIFSGDLFSMYSKYADLRNWTVEILSASEGTMGGYKEIIACIAGRGAFSRLKYERGVHRVQRVPLTETQGRIHTSTCTVAVLPEAEEVEIKIDDKDLRIDVYRSSGAGGQSVNTTDSAVRVTHLPSGLVITCQDERSQWKNKAKALMVLRSRLLALKESSASAERADDRRSQIGTGDRSERIRTYNFPQGRVSDHRIGLTLYQIETIMAGNLDLVIDPLMAHYRAEILKNG
jgi:peptide chain release factor 1